MPYKPPKWLSTFYMTHEAHFLTYGCVHLEDVQEILKMQYPAEALERSIKKPMLRLEQVNEAFSIYSSNDHWWAKTKEELKHFPNVYESWHLLLLVDPGTEIPGKGYRYSETVFYIEATANEHVRRD